MHFCMFIHIYALPSSKLQVSSSLWSFVLCHLCGISWLPAVARWPRGDQPQGGVKSWSHDSNSCKSWTLQNTNKPVKDTPFPSITICTEGINMDAVMEAVAEDFKQWLRIAKNQSTSDETYSKEDHRVNVKEFLYEFFSISHSFNISLDEIVTAFSSPDPSGYDDKDMSSLLS